MVSNLTEQLMRDEGVVLKPYRDHLGFLTIGVGHNLDAKDISKRAALTILEDDINDVKVEVLAKWPWMRFLSVARLASMLNLAFNMGVNGLGGFKKMLAAAEKGEWDECARQLLDSKYAVQVGDRAKRVAQQLRTGMWV